MHEEIQLNLNKPRPMELVLYAILLGLSLGLVFIGPSFFLLIETSLTKGWRHAISLDLGVIIADIVCISVAYFGAKDLVAYIETHPSLYKIGGFIIIIYGGYMFFSKPQLHWNEDIVVGKNYLKTALNGFLLNLLNIGIVIFWFMVVGWVTLNYQSTFHFISFMVIALITFFAIDLAKIFLAKKVQSKLTDDKVFKIRKGLGILLFIFGLVIFSKGFIAFNPIDKLLTLQ